MIGYVRGSVIAVSETAAILDVAGVGYLANAGARTLARLTIGAEAALWVETQVREDSIKLYGFLSEAERAWFAYLQDIPGVGAKVALAILDTLSPSQLADAIALEDKASLARANGVGPKLAARLATELKGKPAPKTFQLAHAARVLSDEPPVADGDAATTSPAKGKSAGVSDKIRADARSALTNLGIDDSTAARAIAVATRTLPDTSSVQELIRAALKEVNS